MSAITAYLAARPSRPTRIVSILALLGVALLGCSSTGLQIETKQDMTTQWSTFKTWSWYEQESTVAGQIAPELQSVLDQRVRNAVEYRMNAKGFTKVDSGRPHMLLAYHAIVEDMDYKSAGYDSNALEKDPKDNYFRKGTLVIDIVDPEARKLIWRGKAQGAIEPEPRKDDKVIREAVDKILKEFPPKF